MDVANTQRAAGVVTPFWIGQLTSMDDARAITVHWYGADVHISKQNDDEDWSRFRFTPRYQATSRNTPVTSVIADKYRCGILAYAFTLKKTSPIGGLMQKTLTLIKERMEQEADDRNLDEAIDTDED